MNIRTVIVLFAAAAAAACDSPGHRNPPASRDVDAAAVWEIHDEADLAFPTCPRCGADVDGTAASCAKCRQRVHIEPKTIECPECHGSTQCTHCGSARMCAACEGTHTCAICDGTGKWHGEACPDCAGSKKCSACAAGGDADACECCDGSHVCANCEGTGKITLQ
jgi:hypothetical protein